MDDGEGVRGVALGARLVAQHAERGHHDVNGPVAGDDLGEHGLVGGHVVGVELDARHRGGARLAQGRLLGVQVVAAPGRQHELPRTLPREPYRDGQADLTAPAQDGDCSGHEDAVCWTGEQPAAGGRHRGGSWPSPR
ncbi:hypothetical protein BAY60_20975 [Prauserella muralis]|uniref:Uncharacterized protein n=1 Tax=Prauserella muralis TaxID=588067 RepID=A0A2V4AQN6_9PSEU|nr:hypothetical protein BAY60_20975 [Prauserella muralis]